MSIGGKRRKEGGGDKREQSTPERRGGRVGECTSNNQLRDTCHNHYHNETEREVP